MVLGWPSRSPYLGEEEYGIDQLFDIELFLAGRSADDFLLHAVASPTEFEAWFGPADTVRKMVVATKGRVTVEQLHSGGDAVMYDMEGEVVFAGDEVDEVRAHVHRLFASLPIRADVAAIVDAIGVSAHLATRVAVHIRRGDIVHHVCETGYDAASRKGIKWMRHFVRRYIPFESYYRVLAERGNPDVIVYSDTLDDARAFGAGYAGDAILADPLIPATLDATNLKKSFVEFMMIGMAPLVLGAQESLFSSYSAYLFGKPFVNVMAAVLPQEFIAAVHDIFQINRRATPTQFASAITFLKLYRDIFAKDGRDTGRFEDAVAALDLRLAGGALPVARAPRDPGAPLKIALAGIVKNEGPGVFEWVTYHALMGFDKIIVFDNASTDDTRAELERAQQHVDLDIIDWPHHPGQIQAYDHCLANYAEDYDFIAFLDADEFLVPTNGAIKDVLGRIPPDAHVAVHWIMYGSSGHVARPEGLVTESFLKRAPDDLGTNRHVKSIVQTRAFAARPGRFVNPHFIEGADYVTPDARPIRWAPNKIGGKAAVIAGLGDLRINHYYTKSRSDYDAKIVRANADSKKPRQDLFDSNDHNDVIDPIIPEKFDRILKTIRALKSEGA